MPTILQLRRGTTAENASYTGSVGELTVDTTLNKVILHDGSTAGGATVGNLQGNIQLGKTAAGEIDTSSGNLTIDSAGGTTTLDDNVVISGNLTVSGTTTTVDSTTISIQNSFVFEGATDDAHETTLTTIDPTADRTISLPNATGTVVLKDTTDELQNKTITSPVINTGVSGSAILDEDNMASDSATKLASQQSIKAYVDTQVATVPTGDITAVVAGTGLSGGANSGSATLAIDTATTVDLTTSQALSNKTLTSPVINTGVSGSAILDEDDFASDSATKLATQQSIKAYVTSQVATANELSELTDTNITSAADGALLFYDTGTSKWIDNVVSGDITIADTGVATIAAGAVDNAMLAGSIANNKLANDSVSFGGISLDLGQSDATPAFDLADATNYPTSSLVGTITNTQLAGSITAAKLAGSIGDSKLSTITTADKVSAAAVQVDGATDGTGITLATTDKLIVDDAGTTKYINASQLNTYMTGQGFVTDDPTALAIALG